MSGNYIWCFLTTRHPPPTYLYLSPLLTPVTRKTLFIPLFRSFTRIEHMSLDKYGTQDLFVYVETPKHTTKIDVEYDKR